MADDHSQNSGSSLDALDILDNESVGHDVSFPQERDEELSHEGSESHIDIDDLVSIGSTDLEHEFKVSSAIVIQKYGRRFIERLRIYKIVTSRYEKIYDPKRKQYYYYDSAMDYSSWKKPRLLLKGDIIEIAPAYAPDHAALILQRTLWRRAALRRVRMLYQKTTLTAIDDNSGLPYYYNPKSGRSSWHLPQFMNNRFDYDYDGSTMQAVETAATKSEGNGDEDGNEGSSDDESNMSEDSAVVRERRRLARKFPRSKAQVRVDAVEDDQALTELDLSGFGASRFTSRIYDMTSLQRLDLSGNCLKKVHNELQYLPDLEVLNISGNNVTTFPKELEELTKLRVLQANHNEITTFSGYFYKITTLEHLDLSHNPIEALPLEMGNLELLKETNTWDVGVGMLVNLKKLELSSCLLYDWIMQLDRITGLTHLDVSHNKLTAVPGVNIKQNTALTYLDVSFNQLKTLTSDIYQLPLQVLKMSNNELTEFPQCNDIIGVRMQDMRELDFSHNSFSSIDKRIAIFSKIKSLRASHNQISTVDSGIMTLSSMEYADLSYNRLEILPISFSTCKDVRHLDLSYNNISQLPSPISSLNELTYLDISHNNIETSLVPMGKIFSGIRHLEYLNLSYNKIETLPKLFYQLKSLTKLDISHNKFKSFSKYLGQLSSLQTIDASYNDLTSMPNSTGMLKELRLLQLNHNNISIVPASTTSLRNLEYIGLQYNDMATFPTQLLLLPKVSHLDLSWNPRLKAHFIDWRQHDEALNFKRDIIPVPTLHRLLLTAWECLDNAVSGKITNFDTEPSSLAYKTPWADMFRGQQGVDPVSNNPNHPSSSGGGSGGNLSQQQLQQSQPGDVTATGEAVAAGKERKSKGGGGKEKKPTKKGNKRSSVSFVAESRFVKQSIEQIIDWNARLREHFTKHCPESKRGFSSSNKRLSSPSAGQLTTAATQSLKASPTISKWWFGRGAKPSDGDEASKKKKAAAADDEKKAKGGEGDVEEGGGAAYSAESDLALSGLQAKDFQAFSMKLASLFHTLGLGAIDDFAETEAPMPDITVIEQLDLGYAFQQSILMFEYIAKELYATAVNRRLAAAIEALRSSKYGEGRQPPDDGEILEGFANIEIHDVALPDIPSSPGRDLLDGGGSGLPLEDDHNGEEEDDVNAVTDRIAMVDFNGSPIIGTGGGSAATSSPRKRSVSFVDGFDGEGSPATATATAAAAAASDRRRASINKDKDDSESHGSRKLSVAQLALLRDGDVSDTSAAAADSARKADERIPATPTKEQGGGGEDDDEDPSPSGGSKRDSDTGVVDNDSSDAGKKRDSIAIQSAASELLLGDDDDDDGDGVDETDPPPFRPGDNNSASRGGTGRTNSPSPSSRAKSSARSVTSSRLMTISAKRSRLRGMALGHDLDDGLENEVVIPLNPEPKTRLTETAQAAKRKMLEPVKGIPYFLNSSTFALNADDPKLDKQFFRASLDCYLGLASALMKRADKMVAAIREIERKAKLPISSVNISQRVGEDIVDLTSDLFDKIVVKDAEKAKKGLKLREKHRTKVGRVEDILNAAKAMIPKDVIGDGLTEESVDNHPDGSVASGKNSRPASRAAITAAEKARVEQEKAVEAAAAAKVAADAAAVARTEELNAKRVRILQKTVAYIWDQRRLLLVWASAAVDTADDMMKFCGWDPTAPAFRKALYVPTASRVDHSKVGEANTDEADREKASDPLGFYSRYVLKLFDAISVEDWAQDLRQCATRLSFIRGRIFQSLNMFYRATHEFRGSLKLSKGYPGALMELVKTLLAQGEFIEARIMLIDMIHKDLPSFREHSEPDPIEVMKVNKTLGMMLMLADYATKSMRLNHLVGNTNQRKMFDVQTNGLLLRHEERHEVELVHGRPLSYYMKRKEEGRREKQKNEVIEADKVTDALRLKAHNMARRCQSLVEETKDSLSGTVDILKKLPKLSTEERKQLRTREKEQQQLQQRQSLSSADEDENGEGSVATTPVTGRRQQTSRKGRADVGSDTERKGERGSAKPALTGRRGGGERGESTGTARGRRTTSTSTAATPKTAGTGALSSRAAAAAADRSSSPMKSARRGTVLRGSPVTSPSGSMK